MFIEQSADRRRAVRTLFVLAGVVPCAALATIAWWWHSSGHVDAVARASAVHLGLPVAVRAVGHPRPGVLRLTHVTLGAAADDDAVRVPHVEVERAVGEVRVRVPRLECSPEAVRTLAGIAGEWLLRPTRFPDAWVVDVGNVAWLPVAGVHDAAPDGWHVECVAVDDHRAVRCRREPSSADEARVRVGPEGLAVEGTVAEAIPLAILAALVPGFSGWADMAGDQAIVSGRIDAVSNAEGWSGTAAGTVEHAALGSVLAAGGGPVQGEAMITVNSLRFAAGRLVACDMLVSASAGTLPQRVLDGLVSSFGCRPGPAYRSIGGDSVRRFDRLACRLVIDDAGLRMRSAEGGEQAILAVQGLSILDEPVAAVPMTRLAWFFSPDGRPAVPATPTSVWLMSVLPDAGSF
jgi:hypothetical protein